MKVNMEENWEKVYTSGTLYRVEILRTLLEEAEIPSIIFNKQDSSYITIGDIELYVTAENVLRARRIVENFDQP